VDLVLAVAGESVRLTGSGIDVAGEHGGVRPGWPKRERRARTPQRLAGPLRIAVAIAAPRSGGGVVLDYERELRNVPAAVRAARQDAADVRVIPFATPEAIAR
jgi:hypothetical protein